MSVSIPIWDEDAARALEPFVPTPRRWMRTVQRLAGVGLDVGVSVTPMMIGLGEDNLAELLREAKKAGARRATMGFLRLPSPVDEVFAERLHAARPDRARRILSRVGERGAHARVIEDVFASTCRRLGLPCATAGDDRSNTPPAGPLVDRTFRRPRAQQSLFSSCCRSRIDGDALRAGATRLSRTSRGQFVDR